MPPASAGRATALFYNERPEHRPATGCHGVFERLNILEHVLGLASHGTVREYRDTGSRMEPICPPVPAQHAEAVRKVEQAVEAFCSEHRDCAEKYADDAVAREIIDALIKTWFANPSRAALEIFAHVKVADDMNNSDARPLLEPWRLLDAAKMTIPVRWHRRLRIKVHYPPWPEAALQHNGPLAAILRWVRGGPRIVD